MSAPPRRLTIEGEGGLRAVLTDCGAALVELHLPDREGRLADVVLGFDDLAAYAAADNPWFGATVGRVANRIAHGRLALGGVEYRLPLNDGLHHLHGGPDGLSHLRWSLGAHSRSTVRFETTSADGHGGYPGTVDIEAGYAFEDPGVLTITYAATTDRPTPLNLTNHTYWNLAGHGAGDVLAHELWIDAEAWTPTDDALIPTGAIASVEGTALDFRVAKPIGRDLAALAGGFDHNLVLRGTVGTLRRVAGLRDPVSGRTLEIETTEPALQLYSGNLLGGQRGKGGALYGRHGAVCLETQHFPDAVNQPGFPSTIVTPGQPYRSTTRWRFGCAG